MKINNQSAMISSASIAARKLQNLANLMRLLSVTFAVWTLWKSVSWWTSGEQVTRGMGRYLDRDLSSMQAWQPLIALGLDLICWCLIVVAVIYCWKFLACITSREKVSSNALRFLRICAWFVLASQVLELFFRPLKTFALTFQLGASEQVFKWAFYSQDFMGLMIGLILLMMSYLFSWTLEVFEENRSFV